MISRICFIAMLFVCAASFASASPTTAEIAPRPPTTPEQDKPPRAAVLDALFSDLAKAKTREEGDAIQRLIQKIWLESDSPSIDLLMSHGFDAFNDRDYDRAFFYFNEVVMLDPGYGEGWHKRATVRYLKNDFSGALADLEHVLRIEPRQYMAMGGLALMLEELGDKKGALEVFRRALSLNPWFDGASQSEKSLSLDIEGRGI